MEPATIVAKAISQRNTIPRHSEIAQKATPESLFRLLQILYERKPEGSYRPSLASCRNIRGFLYGGLR